MTGSCWKARSAARSTNFSLRAEPTAGNAVVAEDVDGSHRNRSRSGQGALSRDTFFVPGIHFVPCVLNPRTASGICNRCTAACDPPSSLPGRIPGAVEKNDQTSRLAGPTSPECRGGGHRCVSSLGSRQHDPSGHCASTRATYVCVCVVRNVCLMLLSHPFVQGSVRSTLVQPIELTTDPSPDAGPGPGSPRASPELPSVLC